MGKLKETPDESQGVKDPSKRCFLRSAAALGVGATIGRWASREERIYHEGLKIPGATFYPVYEIHDEGPHPSQFEGKPPFDAFSIELYGHRYFPPNYLLPTLLYAKADYVIDTTPEGENKLRVNKNKLYMLLGRHERLFRKLAGDGSYLVFPDIMLPGLDNRLVADFMSHLSLIEAGVSSALAALAIKMGGRDPRIENRGRSLSRREFLASLSKAGALYFASPLVGDFLTEVAVSDHGPNGNELGAFSALRRLLLRLQGIQSGFHLEDTILFVRNLVWAIKLLELLDWFGEPSIRLTQRSANSGANIGFLAGASHSGVEDFLVLGKDFCAGVFGLLPRSYLRALSAVNGGVENVSSIRIISPLTPQDVDIIRSFLGVVYERSRYGVVDYDKHDELLAAIKLEEQFYPSATLRSILEGAES